MIDLNGIKNIIFDYGGVIINIDFNLTIEAFKRLGFNDVENVIFNSQGSKILLKMEKGLLSHEEFYNEVRRVSGLKINNEEIKIAWNALLLDMPRKRIKTLEKLKLNYRIFLLSNTNSIHFDQYSKDLNIQHDYSDFSYLFEKTWFSFNLGMAKPDKEIFHFALKDAGINPEETLFIDDLESNVMAAKSTGMQGYFLRKGEDISLLL